MKFKYMSDRTGIVVVTLMLCLAACPGQASSATYTVPGNFPTIQAALLGAPDGSTVFVGPGVYAEYVVAVNLGKNLYVRSTDGAAATAIDGGGVRTLLRVDNSGLAVTKNVVFDGFAFRNGLGTSTRPAVMITNARPTFLNCAFSGNSAPQLAGAVGIFGAKARPSFVNCSFTNNRSGRDAGAILVTRGGGGGAAFATFKSCLFEGNSNATASGSSYHEGGAVLFYSSSGVIQDCIFRGNSTDYAGGAVMALTHFDEPVAAQSITIRGSRFEGNSCRPHTAGRPQPSEGGAVMAENNVDVTITGSVFTGNVAESGGAVHSYRAHLSVVDSVFDGNTANGTGGLGYGGAVGVNLNDAGDADRREALIRVERVMFRNNVAPLGGALSYAGDLAHGKAGTVNLSEVTFASNQAIAAGGGSGNGGGIVLSLASCRADRVHLLTNAAQGWGGGMVVGDGASLTISNSTIAGNTAGRGDAAISASTGASVSRDATTTVAFNNGDGTANIALLAATPRVTFGADAYLTYLVAPYPTGLKINPGAIALPKLGSGSGYAAGTARLYTVAEDTIFSLSTMPAVQTNVVQSANGLTDTWFRGRPIAVPGFIEAEDFDIGGEQIAYHDMTSTNDGGDPYRPDAVDVFGDASAGGGRFVGVLEAGEWLEYSVAATQDQVFDMWATVASSGSEGLFAVYVDGVDQTGPVAVPYTGGERVWNRVLVQGQGIVVGRGQHQVRVVVVRGGFSLDALELTPAGTKSFVTLDVTPLSVTFGDSVTLGGSLRGWPEGGAPLPLAGEGLVLESRRAGQLEWEYLESVTSAADGSFSATHVPTGHTAYRVRWSGRRVGGTDYPPASATRAIQVQSILSLELGRYRAIRGAWAYYRLGQRVSISGAVVPPPYPGQVTVKIERLVNRKWVRHKTTARLLDVAGAYRWSWKPTDAGKYRVRAIFAGGPDAGAAAAPLRYLVVRTP